MVTITIYIEGGGVSTGDQTIQTIDNSALFREGFHKLFLQKFSETAFNLIIEPIGSVSQTKKYLEKIINSKIEAVILIDLDGPKSIKEKRLQDNYAPLDTTRIFFMIQEMESWILSQPAKLEEYAKSKGFIIKIPSQKIENDALIKNIHPEDISDPAEKLSTLFKKYYAVEKMRQGKLKNKPAAYSKQKTALN